MFGEAHFSKCLVKIDLEVYTPKLKSSFNEMG
jgi:hypothetical protein